MTHLKLSVLGPLEIETDGTLLVDLTALKAQALLVYLAVTARSATRQLLAGLLWSDVTEELARTSLRTALSQVRRAVGDHVLADRHALWFDREQPHWIDAHVFAQACRRIQAGRLEDPAERQALREAVHLYRGEFLSDFPETDAGLFEEWARDQREYYRRLALDALQALAHDALARHELDDGMADARSMLALDPLREDAHRTLMELHAAAGDTVAALRQYDECVVILEAELGIPPGDATLELAEALRQGRMQRAPTQTRLADPNQFSASAAAKQAPQKPDVAVFHRLPAALTPFVGRSRELAALAQLLASDETRIVSIVGPGGMGKTRLALAAAEQQVEARRFAQGVYFAELATLDEPTDILPAVAEALRLPVRPDTTTIRTPKQQVLDYLRSKQVLLVLDNFEHLLGGAGLVAELLQAAPGVKILLTARERLDLPGEQVFPILGLDYSVPDNGDPASAGPAVQLFVQSAQRAAPASTLSDEDLPYVEEICRLVEGMPLAIELAAAWADLLSPSEIAAELRSNPDILARERRGAPERHRSIRAVFDTTWQRLDSTEQAVFAALSVFRGGFTRESAEQVAGATLRQLGDLAAKSLVQFDRARNRHTLHEMVRQYGAEMLAREPEREARIRRAHGVRYCRFAQTLGEELLGARQQDAIAELERKAENLREAWHWAARQEDRKWMEQAMDGLGFFYEWQGRLQDGETAFQLACAALGADASAEAQVWLGRALTWRSAFTYAQGKTGEADEYLAEALRRAGQVAGDDKELLKTQAFAWLRQGIQAFFRDEETARAGYTRSLELYRRISHSWGIARSLSGLAQADTDAGNYAGAESRYRAAIDLLRDSGDRRSEAHSLHRLAILLRNAGNSEEATSLARQSYLLYAEIGDRAGIAWSAQILAECLNFLGGHYEEAHELLRSAEALAADLGDLPRLANIHQEQALVLRRMGRHEEAHEQGERGLALARRMGQSVRVAWCQMILANLDLDAGRVEAAATRLQESAQLLEPAGHGYQLAILYAFQARVALAQGALPRARRLTAASLQLSSQHRDTRIFLGLQTLILLLVADGQYEDAVMAFGHLGKWPDEASGAESAFFRQRFAPIMEQTSPQVTESLLARAREIDAWEFAAHWAAKLAQMVEAEEMIEK